MEHNERKPLLNNKPSDIGQGLATKVFNHRFVDKVISGVHTMEEHVTPNRVVSNLWVIWSDG